MVEKVVEEMDRIRLDVPDVLYTKLTELQDVSITSRPDICVTLEEPEQPQRNKQF